MTEQTLHAFHYNLKFYLFNLLKGKIFSAFHLRTATMLVKTDAHDIRTTEF